MQDDVTNTVSDPDDIVRREARKEKIEQIETALRVGDVAVLRELASQPYGLVEGTC